MSALLVGCIHTLTFRSPESSDQYFSQLALLGDGFETEPWDVLHPQGVHLRPGSGTPCPADSTPSPPINCSPCTIWKRNQLQRSK